MTNKFYFKLSFNIAVVFIIVILLSYLPDRFPKLFGDWLCEGRKYVSRYDSNRDLISGYTIGCDYGIESHSHNPCWHWGYQHWLWFLMGLSLFVVQIFRIGEIINNKNK